MIHLLEINVELPDFDTWAHNTLDSADFYGQQPEKVSRALQQAFEQGYRLGKRDAQEKGFD